VMDKTLHHLGTPELQSAIAGSIKRPLNDRWAWHRVNSSVDISPLVAVTLAQWGLRSRDDGVPQVWSVREAIERKRREAAGETQGATAGEPATETVPPTEGWRPVAPDQVQGWVPL